jgi:hypothetical protein
VELTPACGGYVCGAVLVMPRDMRMTRQKRLKSTNSFFRCAIFIEVLGIKKIENKENSQCHRIIRQYIDYQNFSTGQLWLAAGSTSTTNNSL